MEEPMKRLYRTHDDRRLLGICAGIGRYFEVDPVAIRLLWVLVTCVTGGIPGIVAYLLAWLIVPEEPRATVITPAPPDQAGSQTV
jgi:phage shock protein C